MVLVVTLPRSVFPLKKLTVVLGVYLYQDMYTVSFTALLPWYRSTSVIGVVERLRTVWLMPTEVLAKLLSSPEYAAVSVDTLPMGSALVETVAIPFTTAEVPKIAPPFP